METATLRDRIAVTLLEGIGPRTAKNLIAYAGGETEVLKLSRKWLLDIPGIGTARALQIEKSVTAALKAADQETEFIEKHGIKAIYFNEPGYPELLRECDDCPLLLYTRGDIRLDGRKILAVVGTRKATEQGRQTVREVIEELASRNQDLVIVSGLAYGIDIAAHRAAMEYGIQTIGVMGNGFATLYPREHRNTAVKMMDNGGLVTEFTSRMAPERQNFLMRNRVIAGMSHATWVVESASRGGSLITADMANSYNRDVFASPGRVTDPCSAGCNKLIKTNKASLLESAADIEYIMGWENKGKKVGAPSSYQLSEEEKPLHALLREHDKIQLDELAQLTGQNVHLLSGMLFTLELKGAVQCVPGNRYRAL